MRRLQLGSLSVLAAALTACQTAPAPKETPPPQASAKADPAAILQGAPIAAVSAAPVRTSPYAAAIEDPSTRGHYVAGGLYKPGVKDSIAGVSVDADAIPEPDVVPLPRSSVGNRPVYSVLGKEYRVLDDTHGFKEVGMASYYGKKFHGRLTSNREVYDMYAFSAAHKSLPLPSFARVTNLENGKSVVVRVNDRGPFHEGRVIDLSLAAATKLGIVARGTGRVSVEALNPDSRMAENSLSPSTSALLSKANPNLIAQATLPSQPASQPPAVPATAVPTTATTTVATPPVAATPAPSDVVEPALPSKYSVGPVVPARATGTASTQTTVMSPTAAPAASAAPMFKTVDSVPAVPAVPTGTAANVPAATATPVDATAAAVAPQYAFHPEAARFSMSRDGKKLTADQFDEWLKNQKIAIATGKPRPVEAPPLQATAGTVMDQAVQASVTPPVGETTMTTAAGTVAMVAGTAKPVVFAPANLAAPEVLASQAGVGIPAATAPVTAKPGEVILQVGSFSNESNATNAMNKLVAAGISGAALVDGYSAAGARIWRLRVGPIASADSNQMIEQITRLGLGKPQRVM